MKTKFYFKRKSSITCKSIEYFDKYMKDNNLSEIEVYEAIPEIIGGGIFWCKKHKFCGDKDFLLCGKSDCSDYSPRNWINGICRYHSRVTYNHGEKLTLRLKAVECKEDK
jgi:hypothetical protein